MNDARTDELAESDEGEDVIEVTPGNEYFPWSESREEWRRAFIFEHMADPEIEIHILLGNMQKCVHWLTEGTLPEKETTQGSTKKGLKSI